jgi:hypothetical protein
MSSPWVEFSLDSLSVELGVALMNLTGFLFKKVQKPKGIFVMQA